MSKESPASKKKRTLQLIRLLKGYYPEAHCALEHDSAWQLLIATILSAQCTDERVNQVTRVLFKKYPTLKALAKSDSSELEEIVKPTGFFRHKARNIRACAQKIVAEHKGEVPQDLESLILLPGVGRKTANVVLGNAFGLATGVVVDTHVRRLSQRLALTTH